MTTEQIYEKAGFVHEYREEMESFYRRFFLDEKLMTSFFVSVFSDESTEQIPRRMANQLQRFVTLANDIDSIRPDRDPLKVLFLRICLESLCKISGKDKKTFFNSFPEYFTEQGKAYILDNFKLLSVTSESTATSKVSSFHTNNDYTFTLTDFLSLIHEVRNSVTHDGEYWSMQFFARDTDSKWHVDYSTSKRIIKEIDESPIMKKSKILTYHFSTTLQYNEFIFYFVEACINYIVKYIDIVNASLNDN